MRRLLLEALEDRQLLAATVLHRVNAGGASVPASVEWVADLASAPSSLSNANAAVSSTAAVATTIDLSHPSVPIGTPAALFQSERWDTPSGTEMNWTFPVPAGNYQVQLYFAETYGPNFSVGKRVFDVAIEGAIVLNDYDIFADVGPNKGVVKSFTLASDNNLNISFQRIVENPNINAIEILTVEPVEPVEPIVYRVNAGGASLPASVDWVADLASNPSSLSNATAAASTTATVTTSIDLSHPSIPAGTPAALFQTERWDTPSGPEMNWTFPVSAGNYQVRLYFAETYGPNFSVGKRIFDVAIEGAIVLNDYDIFADVGGNKGVVKSFNVVSDNNLNIGFERVVENPNINAIEIVQLSTVTSTASAQVSIAPPSGGLESSTYESNTFTFQNTSSGGQQIVSVKVDLSSSIFMDMVFDPNGLAGDIVAKPFTVDNNTGVGITGHILSGFHDDGYDAIQVDFSTFDPGKMFGFSIDVDPTSVRGSQAPGPSDSASISGLELTGASVTVTFSDGTVHTTRTYRTPNSLSASKNILRSNPPSAPVISVLGVGSTPATVSNLNQTIQVAGPIGSSVVLLVTEGGLFTTGLPGGGFDIDPFEANKLVAVREYFGTVGVNGIIDIPITLSQANAQSGIHSIIAGFVESDGRVGTLSNSLVLKVGAAAPIGFGKSLLAGESSNHPTSIQFGPDGKLYAAQDDGTIKVYTIVRNAANNYSVAATETITLIKDLPNRDDNGVLNPGVIGRLVTGIFVTGTASNPVIYVGSSDPRIGAGESGADLNLDTNSGIISKLSKSGSLWNKQDLVRGLPRSEENHTANGLFLDSATNTLYVAMGGNTNMGATSNNFAYLPEFALSAAILSINLNAIGSSTYDLPTLDDEDRAGTNDLNDPFGGNDGKNQAKLVPGGPVQVYAPGFRNPYDVILSQSGKMYTIDNGPNAGWGDVPINEGPAGMATNQPNEPGVSHGDGLHLITGPGYYGGHPNPTRSNTNNKFNLSNPQSPVTVGNAVESDYLVPGTQNGALVVFPQSTNGLVEYTASNFGGALKGDLLSASFDNAIKRVKLNSSGNSVVLSQNLFSNIDTVPLDVTSVGDGGPLAGTIWVADYISGKIWVFEPNDFGGGSSGGGSAEDLDGDGYSNADESANGTDPNNAGDKPADWDVDFTSNLLDPNDDNDALSDLVDPFAIDANNGITTPIGTSYSWENNAPNASGILRMGFTGLMSDGISNYEALFNTAKITAGGAAGVFTLDEVNAGTATGTTNTQQQAFQFGVNTQVATTPFSAHTRVLAPFAGITPQGRQSMGLFIGNGDQDNYVKIVVSANNGTPAIKVASEFSGVLTSVLTSASLPVGASSIDLYLTVDPIANTVQGNYTVTLNGVTSQRILVGSPISIPASWIKNPTSGMATGIISSTEGTAPTFSATWDFLSVSYDQAPVLAPIGGKTVPAGSTLSIPVSATDADGSSIILTTSALPSFASFVNHGNGTGTLTLTPTSGQVGTYAVTVTATDNVSSTLKSSETFSIVVTSGTSAVVYRINSGGSTLAGTPSWSVDTPSSPSAFSNVSAAVSYTYGVNSAINMTHPSIPAGTPENLFKTERWDSPSSAQMEWNFPVTPGSYEVRLFFAENYFVSQGTGKRVFDTFIEGVLVLNDYDIFADVGANKGVVKSFIVNADSNLDIDFMRVIENPCIQGIEIISLGSSSAPASFLAAEGEVNEDTSSLHARLRSERPYHSLTNRFDVNDDGIVSPVDVLIVINALSQGSRMLVAESNSVRGYIDVNGNGSLEPLDVLQLINSLNTQEISPRGAMGSASTPSGEGNATSDIPTAWPMIEREAFLTSRILPNQIPSNVSIASVDAVQNILLENEPSVDILNSVATFSLEFEVDSDESTELFRGRTQRVDKLMASLVAEPEVLSDDMAG